MNPIIKKYVDNSLEGISRYLPVPNMPEEMFDAEQEIIHREWIPWKAVDSTVTDEDILEIENFLKHSLPESYKEFLKYKHFYELDSPEVIFFRFPIRDWKREFRKIYSYEFAEHLISNNYLPFADYADWGTLCFDANIKAEDNEYPIVLVDHDYYFEEPVQADFFAKNFVEMLKERMVEL